MPVRSLSRLCNQWPITIRRLRLFHHEWNDLVEIFSLDAVPDQHPLHRASHRGADVFAMAFGPVDSEVAFDGLDDVVDEGGELGVVVDAF